MKTKSDFIKPHICVLSFENIEVEYRVRNQINLLSNFYEVDFFGIGNWEPPKAVIYTKLDRSPKTIPYYFLYILLLSIGRLIPKVYKFIFEIKSEYVEAKKLIESKDFDIIHANEWDGLFIAINACLGKKTKIVFDAHEVSAEQQNESLLWKILVKPFRQWLFNNYLSKAEKIITVSDFNARYYEEEYGVKNVSVIYNTRKYIENKFRKIDSGQIKVIHHGGAIRNRSLEKIFELSELLDGRFKISLMLIPLDKPYFQHLQNLCRKHSKNKIEIIDFVDYSKINNILINFDIGIPAISAANKNLLYALGSKFFDYIISGLAIAVPPLSSYKQIVEKYKIGIVAEDMTIEKLALILNNTSTEQLDEYKRNSLKIAKHLSLENENKKLIEIYQEL